MKTKGQSPLLFLIEKWQIPTVALLLRNDDLFYTPKVYNSVIFLPFVAIHCHIEYRHLLLMTAEAGQTDNGKLFQQQLLLTAAEAERGPSREGGGVRPKV